MGYDIEVRTVRADPSTAIKGPEGSDLAARINLAGDEVYAGTTVYVTAVYPQDWNDAYLAGAPVPHLWAGVGLSETPGEDSPSGTPARAVIWWDPPVLPFSHARDYPGIHETMAMAEVLRLAALIGDDAEETYHTEAGDGTTCDDTLTGLTPYPAQPCYLRNGHLSDHEDRHGHHWPNSHQCMQVTQ